MTDAPTRSIVIEREMPHSREKVWRALTQGPLLEGWLMKNDFQPVVGHRFQFRTDPSPHWNGIVDGEVLVVEPNERLSVTWNSTGSGRVNDLSSVVTWTLTPTATGVMLRMEHSGFRDSDENAYRGASYGWQRNIDNLERVVASLDRTT